MRLLDLYSGAGGASMGYHLAGFEVTGVDIAPQPNFPFLFLQADALDFLAANGHEYDVIHASPPCQKFTAYQRRKNHVKPRQDLIGATRTLLRATGRPWVIENLPGAPLINPTTLCGSSFGLDVRRHRCFETNFSLKGKPCNHSWQTPRFPPATNRTNLRSTVEVGAWRCAKLAPDAMGIHWMTNAEISLAIPPAYTKHIGLQLMELLTQEEEEQWTTKLLRSS